MIPHKKTLINRRLINFKLLLLYAFTIMWGSHGEIYAQDHATPPNWLDSIQIAKKQENWKKYSEAYLWLTNTTNSQEGKFLEAYQYALEANDSIRHYLGSKEPLYTNALANLGYFHRRLGQIQAAKNCYDQSIQILQELGGDNGMMISINYYLLGTVFYREGDWLEALAHFNQSKEVWQQIGSPNLPYVASLFNSLGQVYIDLEDWENAKTVFRLNLDHPRPTIQMDALFGMALAYLGEGKLDSVAYFLNYADTQQPPEKPVIPHLGLEILGRMYVQQGKNEQALQAFKEAQARRIVYSPYRFADLARGEQRLAEQFSSMGMFDSALVHIQKGLDFLSLKKESEAEGWGEKRELIYPQWALPIYIQKGKIYAQAYAQGEEAAFLQAFKAFEAAYDILLALQRDRTAEDSKLLLGSYSKQITEEALALLMMQPDEHAIYALTWMERYHAGILYAERQKSEGILARFLPDSLRQREKEMLARISFSRTEVHKSRDPQNQKIKQAALFEELEKYRKFRQEIVAQWPIYAEELIRIEQEDVSKHIAKLKKGESLCAFFIGEERAFTIQADSRKLRMSEITDLASLSEEVLSMYDAMEKPDYSRNSLASFMEISSSLTQRLIPRLNELGEKLFILADGPLAYLPFEILLPEIHQTDWADMPVTSVYRSLPYLCQEKQIAYIHSLSMLFHTKASPGAGSQLAVFAPDYEGDYRLRQNQHIAETLLASISGTAYAAELAKKEEVLLRANNYKYLHFSAHAYPDEASPWDAYIQFAPHDSTAERLYAHEIYNLDLAESLVSLAACDVGKGKLVAGEGVLSLARAFRYAGATTVVQSRWKADERVASALFPLFYQFLSDDHSSLSAFTKARDVFLAEAQPELCHPHYWANFAHWGEDQGARRSYIWLYVLGFLGLSFLLFYFFSKKKQKVVR